ncbi:MAG TPA: hypothetical protein VL335_02110 [Candidatus Paceibacterota bacterium]|jgi:hypothetical protein|nr:hypothetical protein [Candidatus Paceibacterota bacterium]
MRRATARQELAKDLIFVVIGAVIALALSDLGVIGHIVTLFGSEEVASFVAGMFFTSVFTIAPASVALGNIASHAPSYIVALWGALGAVCGDLILFYFIRDRFSEDLMNSFGSVFIRHILRSFHVGFFKWISPVLGALIIASPLPDEFGITLLGFAKTRTLALIPISFIGNILGIYIIVWLGAVL